MLKIRFFFSLQHKTVLRFFPNQKSKNQSKNRGTILADSQTSILSQFSTILHLDFKLAMMPIQPFNYQPPFCSPHALSSFASIYTLQLHKFPPISSTIGMPSAFLKTILASNYMLARILAKLLPHQQQLVLSSQIPLWTQIEWFVSQISKKQLL